MIGGLLEFIARLANISSETQSSMLFIIFLSLFVTSLLDSLKALTNPTNFSRNSSSFKLKVEVAEHL